MAAAARLLAVCIAVAQVCTLAPAARAQIDSREGIALQNQILELRRDLQVLREQSARAPAGGGSGGSFLGLGGTSRPPPPQGGTAEMTAQLLDRVQALEEQVRGLRGRVDELQNTQQRQYDDLSKQIGDLSFRLGGDTGARPLPPAGSLATQPPGPPQVAPGPPVSAGPTRRTPELALQEGNAALARRDYAAAQSSADEVLALGKATPRAYDAQFLRAQAISGRKDWAQAAIAYDDSYNRARTGSHAPDALLGLANSLANLNEKKAACETLGKLKAEFPSPRPDIREQAGAVRLHAGCG